MSAFVADAAEAGRRLNAARRHNMEVIEQLNAQSDQLVVGNVTWLPLTEELSPVFFDVWAGNFDQ